jgi:hypothetical protein
VIKPAHRDGCSHQCDASPLRSTERSWFSQHKIPEARWIWIARDGGVPVIWNRQARCQEALHLLQLCEQAASVDLAAPGLEIAEIEGREDQRRPPRRLFARHRRGRLVRDNKDLNVRGLLPNQRSDGF